jgi:hypothetical protein
MSTTDSSFPQIYDNNGVKPRSAIGLCINCGHRVTLCGRPFTAEIECRNCKKINVFIESQQPVAIRDKEIDGFTAELS